MVFDLLSEDPDPVKVKQYMPPLRVQKIAGDEPPIAATENI